MYSNPFSIRTCGEFSLSDFRAKSPAVALERNLEADFALRVPDLNLDEEKLLSLVPPFDRSEDTAWTLPQLVGEELSQYSGGTLSIEALRERIDILSGTELLASEGFVDDPHDLLCAVSRRYAIILQVDVEQEFLSRIFDERMKFVFDTEKHLLKVFPRGAGEEGFALHLSGLAVDHCFRPARFLRVPRFDRLRFQSLLVSAATSLETLRAEAASTFEAFLAAYEKSYNTWMFGRDDE